MIKCTVYYNEQNKCCGYLVEGHAQEAVCAAVSAITQAVFLGLREAHAARLRHQSEGLFEVEVTGSGKTVRAMIRIISVGLRNLEKQYPQEVRFATASLARRIDQK